MLDASVLMCFNIYHYYGSCMISILIFLKSFNWILETLYYFLLVIWWESTRLSLVSWNLLRRIWHGFWVCRIRIPYPFQWGAPSFDAGEAFAMMMAAFVALVEVISFIRSFSSKHSFFFLLIDFLLHTTAIQLYSTFIVCHKWFICFPEGQWKQLNDV